MEKTAQHNNNNITKTKTQPNSNNKTEEYSRSTRYMYNKCIYNLSLEHTQNMNTQAHTRLCAPAQPAHKQQSQRERARARSQLSVKENEEVMPFIHTYWLLWFFGSFEWLLVQRSVRCSMISPFSRCC